MKDDYTVRTEELLSAIRFLALGPSFRPLEATEAKMVRRFEKAYSKLGVT